ncbi:MAG: hypothetical protein ACJ72L_12905 [Marmoricola sp.]
MTRGAVRWWVPLIAVVALLLTGCVGAPLSDAAWSEKADRALGAATTGVGTAQVVLDGVSHDKLTHAYAVVALTDALEATEKQVDGFTVAQPPDGGHARATRVVAELHRALALLVEVRTTCASPGLTTATTSALTAAVKSELVRLDKARAAATGGGR